MTEPAAYPAEPWHLCGDLHLAALLVPWADLAPDLPPGCRPVSVFGRAIAALAWVEYRPPGVLAYREVMATVLVRRGLRLMVHIVAIWVDSPASRDGGRELWGIPKELATFDFDQQEDGALRLSAADDTGRIATGSVRPRLRLPGRWPVRFSVVQTLRGAAKVSPVRARGQLAFTAATASCEASGPLARLAGRRPVAALSLLDFDMHFGGPSSSRRRRP